MSLDAPSMTFGHWPSTPTWQTFNNRRLLTTQGHWTLFVRCAHWTLFQWPKVIDPPQSLVALSTTFGRWQPTPTDRSLCSLRSPKHSFHVRFAHFIQNFAKTLRWWDPFRPRPLSKISRLFFSETYVSKDPTPPKTTRSSQAHSNYSGGHWPCKDPSALCLHTRFLTLP